MWYDSLAIHTRCQPGARSAVGLLADEMVLAMVIYHHSVWLSVVQAVSGWRHTNFGSFGIFQDDKGTSGYASLVELCPHIKPPYRAHGRACACASWTHHAWTASACTNHGTNSKIAVGSYICVTCEYKFKNDAIDLKYRAPTYHVYNKIDEY